MRIARRPTVSRLCPARTALALVITLALVPVFAQLGVSPGTVPIAAAVDKPENPCAASPVQNPAQSATPVANMSKDDTSDGAPGSADSTGASKQPLLFSDDFEAYGDVSRWRGSQGIAPESSERSTGLWNVRAVGVAGDSGAFAWNPLPSSVDAVSFKVSFRVDEQGDNPVDLMSLRTPSERGLVTLRVDPDGTLALVSSIGGDVIHSDVNVHPRAWHTAELSFTFDPNAGTAASNVWLDEDPVAALTVALPIDAEALAAMRGDHQTGGVIGIVEIGDGNGNRQFSVLFDNVLVGSGKIAATRRADPVSGDLEITTRPALAGVTFQLDGASFVTDASGVARVHVNRWSTDLRQRIVVPEAILEGGVKARFDRWYGWGSATDNQIYAALSLFYPVTWDFVDLQGKSVDSKLVESVTFKSSIGTFFRFSTADQGKTQYLQGSRVVPSPTGPENKEMYLTLDSACVNGANVVNRAQQKFLPKESGAWTIQLLFYSATVSATDAFFGYSIGTSVNVVFPDGTIREVPLEKGELSLTGLPRGDYTMSVNGSGFSPARPITITRDQIVELKVVSYVDMAVAMLVLTTFATGLLLYGRPQIVTIPVRLVWRILGRCWRVLRRILPIAGLRRSVP